MYTVTRSIPIATPKSTRKRKTIIPFSSNNEKEPVQVYCRLRPLEDSNSKSCISIDKNQEICISSELKGVRRDISYKFKHIFREDAPQKEIFDNIAHAVLPDILKGKNSLLFAYGVTGSGKTYTLTGNQDNPGLIPRCIYAIFNSISDLQTPKFLIKPDRMNGFEVHTEEDALRDQQVENKLILKTPKSGKRSDHLNFFVFTNDDTKISDLNKNNLYAVFISYIEIYNNHVYDLLDDSSSGKSLQNKILREDSNHNMYVNGVVEVEIKSAQEAFELLSMGQKRKKMAYTNLNNESSRSHSIFNIRIIQLENGNTGQSPINSSNHLLTISQLSLIDLAGSERTNRTQNSGTRLKEASCINNSLMTLRTCLEILRENQQYKTNKVVPYRDNRLTYLFKNYFEGDGSVQMIVCINPSAENLEENLHVMKFAQMTQDVKILKSEPRQIPVSATKTNLKKSTVPCKVANKNLFSVVPELPTFVFDVNQVEECGFQIENILKTLKDMKPKAKELDTIINKKSTDLRKLLTEADNKEILNKAEINNLNKLLQRHRTKNNNLGIKLLRLESDKKHLLDKNKDLEAVVQSLNNTLSEKQLKINQNMLDKKLTKYKITLVNETMNQQAQLKLKQQREVLSRPLVAKEAQLNNIKEALETDSPELELENISYPSQLYNTPSELLITTAETFKPRRRSRSVDATWLEESVLRSTRKRKSVSVLIDASNIIRPKQPRHCSPTGNMDMGDKQSQTFGEIPEVIVSEID